MSDKVEEEIFLADILDCKSASVGGPFFFNSKSVVSAKKSIKDRRVRGEELVPCRHKLPFTLSPKSLLVTNSLSSQNRASSIPSSQRNKPDYIKLQGPIISL